MKKKPILIAVGLVLLFGAWYAFRPERLWINEEVNEAFPGAQIASNESVKGPEVIAEGKFHNGSHMGTGTATIYRLPDGKSVLRFTEFEVSNGPDVHVYLVAAADAKDDAAVTTAGFVSLGAIKGNKGDQNYDLPENIDLNTYRTVTIWCERFGKNFASAPLATKADAGTMILSQGMFHNGSHMGTGLASVYRLANGTRILRFTEFEVSNGPDVKVYLVATRDATDDATVKNAGFVSLGSIKGNKGDQNYELPADIDLTKYRSVTIWCERFGKNFATAPLVDVNAMAAIRQPVALSAGMFHSVSHDTKGTATIYEIAGGKKILRFTDFETSNGPDVQVYLVAAPDAKDDETVTTSGFYHLAALKGNKGDQNYEIPATVDCSKYRSVTIWCRRFSKNFGTAPLVAKGTTTAAAM